MRSVRAMSLSRGGAAARVRCSAAAAPEAFDVTLNPRVAALKPSKTMALTDLARQLKEEGKDVIGLAAGEPDFDTPAPIVEAGCAALKDGFTRYTPNTGTAPLRAAICEKLLRDNGLEYSPADIVVSNGAKQCIWQALFSVVSQGDEVIIPTPFWVSYPEMVAMAGATPVFVECTAEDGFMLDPAKLAAAITPKTRALILCTPSNPTGAVFGEELLNQIADVVRANPRVVVISDEIYELIMYPPAKHVSFGTLPDMYERTITVNGFSKAFAMTGWRLGYLAAPPPFAKAAAAIQSQSTSGASSVAQQAALTALEFGLNGGEPVAEMVKAFEERRDFVCERISKWEGVTLRQPQGAFYVLPKMSAYFGEGVEADGFGPVPDCDTFCRYLIQEAMVALVPGDAFGAPDCVRISYAASNETLREALDRIERAIAPGKFSKKLE